MSRIIYLVRIIYFCSEIKTNASAHTMRVAKHSFTTYWINASSDLLLKNAGKLTMQLIGFLYMSITIFVWVTHIAQAYQHHLLTTLF